MEPPNRLLRVICSGCIPLLNCFDMHKLRSLSHPKPVAPALPHGTSAPVRAHRSPNQNTAPDPEGRRDGEGLSIGRGAPRVGAVHQQMTPDQLSEILKRFRGSAGAMAWVTQCLQKGFPRFGCRMCRYIWSRLKTSTAAEPEPRIRGNNSRSERLRDSRDTEIMSLKDAQGPVC